MSVHGFIDKRQWQKVFDAVNPVHLVSAAKIDGYVALVPVFHFQHNLTARAARSDRLPGEAIIVFGCNGDMCYCQLWQV